MRYFVLAFTVLIIVLVGCGNQEVSISEKEVDAESHEIQEQDEDDGLQEADPKVKEEEGEIINEAYLLLEEGKYDEAKKLVIPEFQSNYESDAKFIKMISKVFSSLERNEVNLYKEDFAIEKPKEYLDLQYRVAEELALVSPDIEVENQEIYNDYKNDLLKNLKYIGFDEEIWNNIYVGQQEVLMKYKDRTFIPFSPPEIGMTQFEVLASLWGKPTDINKTTTQNGVSEQWVYPDFKYVYFDDGIVTAIQE